MLEHQPVRCLVTEPAGTLMTRENWRETKMQPALD